MVCLPMEACHCLSLTTMTGQSTIHGIMVLSNCRRMDSVRSPKTMLFDADIYGEETQTLALLRYFNTQNLSFSDVFQVAFITANVLNPSCEVKKTLTIS